MTAADCWADLEAKARALAEAVMKAEPLMGSRPGRGEDDDWFQVDEAADLACLVLDEILPLISRAAGGSSVRERLHWPRGLFTVHDPDPNDDHGPIYLVCPTNGLMVDFSADPTPGLDAARVQWIADALNAKLIEAARHSQPGAEGGWQPIETAPTDGTLVMVGAPGCGVSLVRWMLDSWIDEQGFTQGSWPTHWMPLPASPQQPATSADEKVGAA